MTGSLQGQVALVTGASSGIGRATASALASAGAQVVAVARRAERLEALVESIRLAGGEALALPGDISQEAFAKGAVASTMEHFGRLDILVNAAGIIQADNLARANLDQWRRVLDVNLMGAIYTCHAAVPPMVAQGSGYIINVGSLACRTTSPVFNSYATSKAALNAMTDGLRQEVGPSGVRVCMLAPGSVATEVAEGISDDTIRGAIRDHVHQEGALIPEDIATLIAFIVSLPQRVDVSELWVRATTDILY